MKNHLTYRLISLLILGSMILPRMAHADITSNLVGWWKFDEGSGTTAADSSGSSNTGTLVNSAGWTSSAKIGAAALSVVDNGSGSSPYVSTVNNITGSHTDQTWAAWVYPADLTGHSGHNIFLASTGWGWMEVLPNGHFTFNDRVGTTHEYTGATIPLNTWTHLALTCSDGTGAVTMYINGSQVEQDTGGATACFDNFVGTAIIGTYPSAPGALGWTGNLDDVRVYSRVLSSSDIAELYAYLNVPPSVPVFFHSLTVKLGRLFTVKLGRAFRMQ